MDRRAVTLLFRQIREGWDVPTPTGMLRVKGDAAAREVAPLPYSLLTNLCHTVYWQRLWLASLHGEPRPTGMKAWTGDWRVPEASEWPTLRAEFLAGLDEAARIANSEPFDHRMESDEKAIEVLVALAVHAAYHLGQMNLLKRAVREVKR
ncbi:MAG: DinB family protein [Fimbriimonadaceae bacterium]|nr:DinB family protein [Fimbriimonadaceae bacterium]